MFILKNLTTEQNAKSGLVPRSLVDSAGEVGFTLIELLVVIVIIGILATLTTVSLTSARAKARDARRISDLKQISSALELYYADNNAYPSTITFGSALVGADNKTYMAKVPSNPTPRAEGACLNEEYQYFNGQNDFAIIGCISKQLEQEPAGSVVYQQSGIARSLSLGPTDGLVAWWPLNSFSTVNGVIRDFSGNNNNGTNYGAVLGSGPNGLSNDAYYFDGTNYISIPDSNSLDITTDFTFTFWHKSTVNNISTILSKGSLGGHPVNYLIQRNTSPYVKFVAQGSGLTGNCWWGNFPVDNWHFYSIVKSQACSTTCYDTGIANTLPVNIGRAYALGSGDSYFTGYISDIRIYNRTLSAKEIATIRASKQ